VHAGRQKRTRSDSDLVILIINIFAIMNLMVEDITFEKFTA
jgi:hypothetical protein